MKFSAIITKVHLAARTTIVVLAISAAVLDYPGAKPRKPTAEAAVLVRPTARAVTAAAVGAGASRGGLLAPGWGVAFLASVTFSHVPGGPLVALQSLSPILAQATFDAALQSFLGFLAKILILIGIAVVFYGGWMVSQGKSSEGVLAIIGGFLIASAIPILRLLAQFTGTTF
jgi:hypothetical protein